MKGIVRLLFGLALLAVLTALAAAPAGAAKAPKTAKFKASLKGEQTITWSYQRQPQAPCYGGENAGGSVRMFYESTKPAAVTAYEIKKNTPLWDSTHQRVVFTPGAQLFASATFEGLHTAGQPPMPDQCDDNGGGVEPQPTDCANATALINAELAYVNKDRLLVTGDATSWDPGGEELRNMFNNCPYWQGGPYSHEQAEGDLTPADVKFKEAKLFDAKGPSKIVLHGSQTDCYEGEGLSVCGSRKARSGARSSPPGPSRSSASSSRGRARRGPCTARPPLRRALYPSLRSFDAEARADPRFHRLDRRAGARRRGGLRGPRAGRPMRRAQLRAPDRAGS